MSPKQFGFPRGRLTTDPGVELMKYIFDAREDSYIAIGVYCDLSKQFTCVHLDTRARYGLEGVR